MTTAPWVSSDIIAQHSAVIFWSEIGKDMTIFTHCSGPQEDPNECGTPILCVFYGLLAFIVVLTAYTTLCRGDLR